MNAPERKDASTPYEIVEVFGAWFVIGADVDGPFANNAEAWSWVDRHTVRVIIEHETTDNLPNGQPCPPADDHDWAVVRRSAGFTFWRRIFLTTNEPQRTLT